MTQSLRSSGAASLNPDTATRHFWLFQYKEDLEVNREVTEAKPGAVINWKLTAHKTRVQPGDVVFFWCAGTNGGLSGWGEIAGTPIKEPDDTFERIPVRTGANFAIIPRDRVRQMSEVSDLRVIMQGAQGSNFQLSSLQALGLARLIGMYHLAVPEIDPGEARDVVRRRLQRDLSQLRSAIAALPNESPLKPALRARVDDLIRRLASDDFGADRIADELEGLRQAIQQATLGPGATSPTRHRSRRSTSSARWSKPRPTRPIFATSTSRASKRRRATPHRHWRRQHPRRQHPRRQHPRRHHPRRHPRVGNSPGCAGSRARARGPAGTAAATTSREPGGARAGAASGATRAPASAPHNPRPSRRRPRPDTGPGTKRIAPTSAPR